MDTKKNFFNHRTIFLTILAAMFILLVFIQFNLNTNYSERISYDDAVYKYEAWDVYVNDLSNEVSMDSEFKTDGTIILKTTLPESLRYSDSIGFFSNHQNIEAYVDDELIFEFYRDNSDSLFGHTPGNAYNLITHLYDYAGKDLYIHISSPYDMNNTDIPVFYLGDPVQIINLEIKGSSNSMITGIILMVMGLFSILLWLWIKKFISSNDYTLLYAGLFCVTISLWSTNEQKIITYFLGNSIVTSYLSFISLLLFPIAIILFFRELCNNKEKMMWHVVLSFSYLNIIVTTALQLLNIADYRECLYYNLIVTFITILIVFLYSTYITLKSKLDVHGRINLVCVILLYLGMLLYLYSYFYGNCYILYYGTVCIILYIAAIITIYIRQTLNIMFKSTQAEIYEDLAYKDSLTGLYNRLAYDKSIASTNTKKHAYIIVIFDLNNLKYFNDTYGHDMGDKYIIDSSTMIKEAFGDLGNVYRIGGDEFCVILENKSVFQYETATHSLDTKIYNYNKISEVLKINIAYGYALYDKSIDRDILETRNRADAMMYKKKFFMKQNQVSKL